MAAVLLAAEILAAAALAAAAFTAVEELSSSAAAEGLSSGLDKGRDDVRPSSDICEKVSSDCAAYGSEAVAVFIRLSVALAAALLAVTFGIVVGGMALGVAALFVNKPVAAVGVVLAELGAALFAATFGIVLSFTAPEFAALGVALALACTRGDAAPRDRNAAMCACEVKGSSDVEGSREVEGSSERKRSTERKFWGVWSGVCEGYKLAAREVSRVSADDGLCCCCCCCAEDEGSRVEDEGPRAEDEGAHEEDETAAEDVGPV